MAFYNRSSCDPTFIDIQEVTGARFSRTIDLRKQFSDKPKISFTDLSTMAIMVELGIHGYP